jgi:hypothetical protein
LANERAQQRDQIILEYGILIQPFVELERSSGIPNENDYRIACAKVQSGNSKWGELVRQFTHITNDIDMMHESSALWGMNNLFVAELNKLLKKAKETKDLVNLKTEFIQNMRILINNFSEYVDQIPVEWEPEIFEANTPFTAYLRIKAAMRIAKKRIHYFDRYLTIYFYDVFLNDINRDMEIRLITTAGKTSSGIKGVSSVSDLAKKEFTNYQLIEVSQNDIHDRNLRVDNEVFTLGPGVEKAGLALTNFGPAESSLSAHESLDQLIRLGKIIHRS